MSSEVTIVIIMALFAFLIISPIVFIKRWQRNREFQKFQGMTPEQRQLEMLRMQEMVKKYQTSHLLHLVITIFCLGLWIIPWIIIANQNAAYRKKYEDLSGLLVKSAKS